MDTDWRSLAACRTEEPELFFPVGTSGPALVDAVTPGGEVVGIDRLAREIAEATADDDRSAGACGSSRAAQGPLSDSALSVPK